MNYQIKTKLERSEKTKPTNISADTIKQVEMKDKIQKEHCRRTRKNYSRQNSIAETLSKG